LETASVSILNKKQIAEVQLLCWVQQKDLISICPVAGPGAYVPDTLQPIGLLCDP